MSHTRVKCKYSVEGPYGSSEEHWLYCHHNNTSDMVTFYDEDGSVADMMFSDSYDHDVPSKREAMEKLFFPYDAIGGFTLQDGIEYWTNEDKERLGR